MRCQVGRYEGDRRRIHGHGVVERQQRGPPGPGEAAACAVLAIRRYLCTACGAVMRVVPGSCAASKHFSGAAIGLALALWGAGKSAAEVRAEVSDWKVVGAGARGWRALSRWAKAVGAGKLFVPVRRPPFPLGLSRRYSSEHGTRNSDCVGRAGAAMASE